MAKGRQSMADAAAALARQLHLALLRERIVRRFADSYVLENERQALQAHAVMYRDLLALLDREALLALSVRALEIVCDEPRAQGRSKRSEEHTSELQSRLHLVCRLLLEKKKANLRGREAAAGGRRQLS